MEQITKRAYAKINLCLDVLRKREDGYHDVKMVMQTIGLYDRITCSLRRNNSISVKTNLCFLPTDENNLVYRAARLFRSKFDCNDGVSITLEKRIPVAAGLAGGSSDAAACLLALNELYGIRCPSQTLAELSIQLGADVPYCLMGGTALSEGIGERLTVLPAAPACHCLLVKPNFPLSTRYVYEHLSLTPATVHPNVDSTITALINGDLISLAGSLGNILETVSIACHPEILAIKETMLEMGALNALMSGSGPTVFGLFDNKKSAEAAFYQFKVGPYGRQTFLTTLQPAPL